MVNVITINRNSIVDISDGRGEMLGVSIILRVEEHLVGEHVSEEDDSSVLAGTPPGMEREEFLIELVFQDSLLWGGVTKNQRVIEQLVVLRQESVPEGDLVLAVRLGEHAEVDRVLEHIILVFVGEHNLIVHHASTGHVFGVELSGSLLGETSEQVGITTLSLKLDLELLEVGHGVSVSGWVQLIEEVLALVQIVVVDLLEFDISRVLELGGNAERDRSPVAMLVPNGKDVAAVSSVAIGAVGRIVRDDALALVG